MLQKYECLLLQGQQANLPTNRQSRDRSHVKNAEVNMTEGTGDQYLGGELKGAEE